MTKCRFFKDELATLRLTVIFLSAFVAVIETATYSRGERQYETIPPTIKSKSGESVSPLEFPKVKSEDRFWASLVSVDPINRRGVLRLEDRDRMINFSLLPSAPLFYRGAPAALGDFSPGTMVEVWGYGDEKTTLPRNILRLSDDFSVKSFSELAYRVESIDLEKKTFLTTIVATQPKAAIAYIPQSADVGNLFFVPQDESEKKVEFSFNDQTNWYIGARIGDVADLAIGQIIKANFNRKFFAGPPLITRCKDVWLDIESQELATRHQLKSFTSYVRDHGFPLRVDAIDDQNKILTVTLLESGLNDILHEWKVGQVHDLSALTINLRMWEPNGGQSTPDRMFGVTLKEIQKLPIGYGCGGARLTFSVPMLYEAYRPGTILKLYPTGHPVPVLPIEERMPKEFDTYLNP